MTTTVRPKKFLGQHFLRDQNIARNIVGSLTGYGNYTKVLEVGPGTGVLSKFLINDQKYSWTGVELDRDSIQFLKTTYPSKQDKILEADFLRMDLKEVLGGESTAIIGNFPYNISSQIVFKVLENKEIVPEVVGMFQKEVALRLAAPPGSKTYGIISVLTQAHYNVEVLFFVDEHVFDPPPKVKSAVIRMQRNYKPLPCDEGKLALVVKTAFNQRRKTLRNSLKGLNIDWQGLPVDFQGERPEQLSLDDFFLFANNCH